MPNKVNKISFTGQSFYIGIDCHKKSWKVTILGEEYEHKTFSQNPDPEILANYMHKNFPDGTYYAAYEAGFHGFSACRTLNELGVKCSVIHAADIPTTNKEKLQKSDPIDSRKIARSLRGKELNDIHIPELYLEADRALLRYRFKLVKDISRVKNRIKSLLFQFGIEIPEHFTNSQTRHWSRIYIDWLKGLPIENESLQLTLNNILKIGLFLREELLIVNKQIKALSQTEKYKHNIELAMSVPGIGVMTAMSFLTQIGDVSRFEKADQLYSYVGLIPKMHGSGEKVQTSSIIKRGRKELKIMLIEASWDAIRFDPALMLKFNELALKMNKNKAIIRIARKLVNRLRHVLINNEEYVKNIVC